MPDAKSPYASLLSPTSSTLFSDLELHKPIKIKLKTTDSSPASPPKWKDVAREIEAESKAHGNQSPPSTAIGDLGSPVSKQLDPRDRLVYGKLPMTETPDLISCPRCKRPILRQAVRQHLESCTKEKTIASEQKKEKLNGEGKDTPNGEPPSANKKKRKHDDGDSVNGETTPPKLKKPPKREKEDSETKKEKKKKPPKVTVQKPKLPVDVEKQCGVWDPDKQTMCARSLTCKSHSMSAKRAVPGRSQPYDVLLSLWQRKNQVKAVPAPKPVVVQDAEDVDSDEEVRLVMSGVARRYCRPMEQRCIVGVRRKVRGMRMYEGLKGALLGAVSSVPAGGVGRGRRQSQATEGI